MADHPFSRGPMIAITTLRVVIGWHFLYEGLAKLAANDDTLAAAIAAGTPAEIVNKLNAEINRIAGLPDVRERLAAQGLDAIPSTPEAFTRAIHDDYARWGKVVEASGARLD